MYGHRSFGYLNRLISLYSPSMLPTNFHTYEMTKSIEIHTNSNVKHTLIQHFLFSIILRLMI